MSKVEEKLVKISELDGSPPKPELERIGDLPEGPSLTERVDTLYGQLQELRDEVDKLKEIS